MGKQYKYELEESVVNYILQELDSVHIKGVNQAQSLLEVTKILQNPKNASDLEKAQMEELKAKYENKAKK